jgi:hypothetical protein
MNKTIKANTEMVVILRPGVKLTLDYESSADVHIIRQFPQSDNYDECEQNMLDFIKNMSGLQYIDNVIDMYTKLDKESRVRVIDELEWTKYKRDFFVREFIDAVTTEFSNMMKNSLKG